jgi:hypothetical protein
MGVWVFSKSMVNEWMQILATRFNGFVKSRLLRVFFFAASSRFGTDYSRNRSSLKTLPAVHWGALT